MALHARLTDGWRVWTWFQVRGAGFPVETVLRLAGPVDDPEAARALCRRELRALAADAKFREAITWQNRKAVDDGLDSLLRQKPDATDARTRRKEQMVASYAQRYATKNDTIGFMGPIGYGRMGDAFSCVVGKSLVKKRTVYFEPWALRAFAHRFAMVPQVRIHLAPSLAPALSVRDGKLFGLAGVRSVDGSESLPETHATLLAMCDGETPAWEIASRFPDQDAVYDVLAQYADRGVLVWDIPVPAEADGLPRLANAFERIGDDEARASALECLRDLNAAREAVHQAAGTPVLGQKIAALEETFSSITGESANRNDGQVYAGRALIYEDCMRDIELVVGEQVRARMAGPLALLLQSARWFTHEIGRRHFQLFRETLRGLGDDVDFTRFWHAIGPSFAELTPPIFAEVMRELQQRWARVLDGKSAWKSTSLGPRVMDVFAAPHPGWPSARHHCPDVMICAPSTEAIARGDFRLVLGELHAGLCVFSTLSATMQAPDVQALRDAYEEDIGLGIAPVAVDNFARSSHDSRLALKDIHIETVPEVPSWRPRSQVVRLGDLRIRVDGKRIIVLDRESRRWDVMQVMERPLKTRAAVAFNPFPAPGERILVDDVVLARKRWVLGPAQLSGFSSENRVAYARSLGLPRFIFIKVPTEVKPCFVDLDSVALVELMCRMAKGAPSMTVSEMLPAPDDCWLPLPDGKRCTSELRMVAVDDVAWRPFEGE